MSVSTTRISSEDRLTRRALGAWAGALLTATAPISHHHAAAQADGWQQLAIEAAGPSPRWDHTLSAHNAGKSLIVFGGRDADGAALGDTWLFSRTRETWELVDSPGPAPRFGHAVATDQERELLYLFGGQAGADFFNDLWRLDMARGAWTQVGDGSGIAVSPRYGTSLVLTDDGTLVVSHGFTFEGRFDDTWAHDIDTGAWVEISPELDLARPLKRCLHEAVWAEHLKRMVLFGGCSSGFGPCPQGDLWSFEPSSRIWIDRTIAEAPNARSNPALVYDAGRDNILLIGGLTDTGYAADLWSLTISDAEEDGPVWAASDLVGPAPRASHDAVMTGPWLYLFGGFGNSGALNDLWVLDARNLGNG